MFEFLQSRLRSLMGLKPQQPLEQINQRKQCCVLRVLCTPTFPTCVRFVGDVVLQRLDEPGFPNTCFARQEYDLPISCLGLLPAFQQERDFRLSTDQWCQSSCLGNLQSTIDTTFVQDAIDTYRLSHTSQRAFAQFLAL